jgi:hypothetical protein
MSEWLPMIILKTIHHKIFVFHILIGHNNYITTIDFGVTFLIMLIILKTIHHKVFIFQILIGHN